jgi:2-dehydropantoate 2-reductase
LIYGAGVIGSIFAYKLKAGGNEVTILARGERFGYLQSNGITLRDDIAHVSYQINLDVTSRLDTNDEYDLIMVIMQRQQIKSILPLLQQNIIVPSIIFVGNNVEGAEEYLKFLTKERILLGFGGVGGYREHQLVITAYLDQINFYVGELTGIVTDRLKHIKEAFTKSGINVELIENMDAWLKSHAALISALAMGSYAARDRNTILGETKELADLSIKSVKENFKALKELGIPILPSKFKTLSLIPTFIIRRKLLNLVNSDFGKIALSGHAMAAREEMIRITNSFRNLVKGVKTDLTSNNKLYALSFGS